MRTTTPPRPVTPPEPRIGLRRRVGAWLRTSSLRWLLLLPLGAVLWLVGRAVGLGGVPRIVALSVAGAILVTVVGGVLLARRVGWGALALEVPVLLLLLSTLVFRQRTATDLAEDPLDVAAQFRVAAVAVAGILGFFALLWGQVVARRVGTLPLRLYALYVLVVFAGAPFSVDPPLTAYRGLELLAALVVMAGAKRSLGEEAGPRIEATIYWFLVALIATVWVEVIFIPEDAIVTIQAGAPVDQQIQGVYPSLAANTVGLLGVLVAAWSPARIRRAPDLPGLSRPTALVLTVFGTVTLLASQYRTGYVALAAVLALYVLFQGRKLLATLLVVSAVSIALWAPAAPLEAQPFLLRGQTPEEVGFLSGRTVYWGRAVDVWRTSPIIGRGLLTASRFEVLEPLGLPYTAGIHGTWPEALVGTGILGTVLLVLTFLICVRRGIRVARSIGWIAPLALLTVLAIRSITGPSFEVFALTALVFLWLTAFLESPRSVAPDLRDPVGGHRQAPRSLVGSSN